MDPVLVAGVVLYAGDAVHAAGATLARKAGLPHRAASLLFALRVGAPSRVAGASSYVSPTRTAASRTCSLVIAGLLIFWTFVLNRTQFGRHIYAVGGNAEAARRAGINVDNVKIACFAICSMMAALGGIVLASRLRSVDTNSGGGSILLYSIAARRHRRHVAVRRPRPR